MVRGNRWCGAHTWAWRPGGAGRRKPGLPHLLNLRDWSGGAGSAPASDPICGALWMLRDGVAPACRTLRQLRQFSAFHGKGRPPLACVRRFGFFLRGAKLIERDRVAALARRFVRSSTARRLAAQRTGRAAPSVRGTSREAPGGVRAQRWSGRRRHGGLIGRPGACEESSRDGPPGVRGIEP